MAYATQLTVGTGRKVSINYQSQEASVSVTYQLEQGDKSVLDVVREKSVEVEKAHRAVWRTLKESADATPQPESNGSRSLPEGRNGDHSGEYSNGNGSNGGYRNGNGRNGYQETQQGQDEDYQEPRGNRQHDDRVREPLTEPQERAILALRNRNRMTWEDLRQLMQARFQVRRTNELSKIEASQLLTELQRRARDGAAA